MISNYKRAVALTLLASAASVSFAAPAPVSDLNSSSASTSKSSSSAKETETERLERLLRNSNRVQANLQQQVDEMSLDMSELRGELERNNHEMRQLIDRQRELFIELDKVRSELAKAKQAPAQHAESAPAGKYSSNQDEQKAYQSAVDLILKNKDYDAATVALEQFKKDFPESVYSPNANYWLGQLYFSKKKDVDSAKAFAAVVAYKDSNKRADALVKLGDIASRNNSTSAAKKYYQQAVDEYPNTSSANSAKKKLSNLK
ncbi:tol-pal system protein YbgF [Vibrio breoganii]|uniref:Cell division coordinator CpoB n=1 Tax=Vibrio breoganii TaxID=553239 RepID=A0AAN1CS69_9VIBR|nr:tol-pal system protein YbgF [Vibrio breoganii]ANO33157.1 tol-pal system protein YbgF [Vibrio breoganii]MDN3714776.1 tol-pal system protein YbgF [Vibrio breoganii]PMG86409.1 tol-pal system protein YbgF [Vibrio breoganii]PML01420.1 tol-pal system protein YbgF [Vibrio breoganii]PMO29448.1 tol-pal system protein YbgF [Vibrio breoganii]